METKEFQFKTTLNCSNCVAKVKPGLDAAEGIENWSVDTENPDKILTVSSKGISREEVIDLIESKGFDAETIA